MCVPANSDPPFLSSESVPRMEGSGGGCIQAELHPSWMLDVGCGMLDVGCWANKQAYDISSTMHMAHNRLLSNSGEQVAMTAPLRTPHSGLLFEKLASSLIGSVWLII